MRGLAESELEIDAANFATVDGQSTTVFATTVDGPWLGYLLWKDGCWRIAATEPAP
ncbi:MAG: hypothetical protein R2734_06050 [Nocardioides sp.]